MKKSLFIASAAAVVLLTSCVKGKETVTTFKTNEAQEAVNVKVKKVAISDVDQLVEFTANVQADVVNKIAPQAPTRIRKIYVEVGNRVRKGQKLVDLDNTQLANLELQLNNARVEFLRTEELYKIGGVSKSMYEAQQMQFNMLEKNYANLVENTTLVAPIDGIVSARNYDEGDLYNGQTPVLTVEQMSPVKILLDVNEQYYKDVKVGMPVSNIALDAFPGETFEGKVSIIYPTLDAATRTFKIEVQIANAAQRVRPGMFARVTLNFGTKSRVVVPDQAVIKQQGSGERFVYVVNADNTVSHKTVELGRRLGAEYEVISGVDNGQTVVVFGHTLLTDGRNVNILN